MTKPSGPHLKFERKYKRLHNGPVAGVDEAGRGPLAGPVVAAAVVLDPKCIPEGVNDSKMLTAAKRADLCARLLECAKVGVGIASQWIIGGDALCMSIAAASIVAKHQRDCMMAELDALHPGYGWASNKGYSAKAHFEALRTLGPTPHHRRSFAPVAQAHFDFGTPVAAE